MGRHPRSSSPRNRSADRPTDADSADSPDERPTGGAGGAEGDAPGGAGGAGGGGRRRAAWAAGLIVLLVGGAALADWWIVVPTDSPPHFVGGRSCIECHQAQHHAWTGSHHDLAMDHARPETVLGDFNDAKLEYLGVTARMFRRDGKFFVNTEGPDGRPADFEVKYVLGVAPLQQYMVEFDRVPGQPPEVIGRLQVLRECWDVTNGRWFYLPPPDVDEKLAPDDELHWTGTAQRWNTMCADCHSTNLKRNFDVERGLYMTTYTDIDVSCEACHGPGSRHVELAESWSPFWDRKIGYGLPRLKGKDPLPQIETCAPCHSRRRLLHDDPRPGDAYLDGHVHGLLDPLTYHADGQILDEVYEYGSFLQSKMFHKGIRCSDCHDPHSAKLKHQGNLLCTSCHQHPAGKYDGPAHTHHQPGSPGASCVECHMPETHYMEVDPRRDHSIRVPRPGLSVALGAPNACTRCHLERDKSIERLPEAERAGLKDYPSWLRRRESSSAVRAELERVDRWARDKALAWWGEKMDDSKHYAHVLHAARTDVVAAEPKLVRLAAARDAPGIVRATALMHLAELDTAESLAAARKALADPDGQVRGAAVARYERQLETLRRSVGDPRQLESLVRPLVRDLQPLLDDPLRFVRFEAARQLARVPDGVLRQILLGDEFDRLDEVLEAYIEGLKASADRAGSHLNLGLLQEDRGLPKAAEEAYRRAVFVEPRIVGPRTNLAALLDRWVELMDQERETALRANQPDEAERLEREAARARAEIAKLRAEELPLLERDAKLSPRSSPVQYRYAMALYLSGDKDGAERTLRKSLEFDERSESILFALALLYQQAERWQEAGETVARLREISPQNPTYEQLQRDIESRRRP